jgi:hypothetical protein
MDYSFEWVRYPDLIVRLYRALNLIRNMVRIVYRGPVVVGWSSPEAPYQGVMQQTEPKTILINPGPLLAVRPEEPIPAYLIDTLHGIPLHEAGHAAFTPPDYEDALQKTLAAHREVKGYRLPIEILTAVKNWVEDEYVEGEITREHRFPGFRRYFQNTNAFFLPDEQCRHIVERAHALWPHGEREFRDRREIVTTLVHVLIVEVNRRLGVTNRSALLVTCMDLLSVLVHRPGLVDAESRPTFQPLLDAAQAIRAAGTLAKLAGRVKAVVQITDDLFHFLMDLTDEDPSAAPWGTGTTDGRDGFTPGGANGAGEAPQEAGVERQSKDPVQFGAIARAIDAALAGQRLTFLRDDGDPVGSETTGILLTEEQAAALDALEKGKAEFLPPEVFLDRAGIAEHRDKTLRIIDSTPETLPNYDPGQYAHMAARLLRTYRRQAEELRQRLWFREGTSEYWERGQRSGTLDEDDLIRPALGDTDIYMQQYRLELPGVDLTLLVDESGSMATGNRWQLAAAASVCVEYAVRYLEGVRLQVYGYTSDCFQRGETVLFRHFDSAVPRLRRIQPLGWAYPKSNNADGIALAGVARLLREDRSPDVIPSLLMISDGQPVADRYEGAAALKHVSQVVKLLLNEGIRFAHLQIGPTADCHLNAMYGTRWARVMHPDDLPNQVAGLVLRWLSPPGGSS